MLADLTKLRDVFMQVGSAQTITETVPPNGEDTAVVARAASGTASGGASRARRPRA